LKNQSMKEESGELDILDIYNPKKAYQNTHVPDTKT